MRPPKSLMGRNSFLVFVWFTHMWALWLFSSIQYYCSMVAIYYDVRSSHIVSIRTCHFSKQQQQPVRVKWEDTSYSVLYVRVAVYQSTTTEYKTSYDTCRGINVWPMIASKFAKSSSKLDRADKTRCTWPFQAKTGTMWRWPMAWLLACDLYLVLECTCFWHKSDKVYLILIEIRFTTVWLHSSYGKPHNIVFSPRCTVWINRTKPRFRTVLPLFLGARTKQAVFLLFLYDSPYWTVQTRGCVWFSVVFFTCTAKS